MQLYFLGSFKPFVYETMCVFDSFPHPAKRITIKLVTNRFASLCICKDGQSRTNTVRNAMNYVN